MAARRERGRDITRAFDKVARDHGDRLARLDLSDEECAYISGSVAEALADAIQDCETARTSSIPLEEWKAMLEGSGLDEQTQQDLATSSPQVLAAGARLTVENARADAAAADRSVARMRAEHPELADAVDHALAHGAQSVLLHRWAATPTVAAGGAAPGSRSYLGDPELVAAVRHELLTGTATQSGIRLTIEEYEALGHRTLTNLRAQITGRFDYYYVRADAGETVGSIIRVPCGSMDCYKWRPDSGAWVYDEGLSSEIGYPMTEIVFEKITPQEAAALTSTGDDETRA